MQLRCGSSVSYRGGAEKGLQKRFNHMLEWIKSVKQRRVREVEGHMLLEFGISPRKTMEYLEWAERYGLIQFTNVARSVVEAL
jgi:hypothetical protein